MLWTLFLIYLVRYANANAETAEIIPRCSDAPGTRMTFTPVKGYVGRYTAEFCTYRNSTHKEWELRVSFYSTRDYCNASHPLRKHVSPGQDHSNNVEWISSQYNCTNNQTVCMSAQFDLIFSACYAIRSRFIDKSAPALYYYFNITNPYTADKFHKNQAIVDISYHQNDTSLVWHPGIPPSVYRVEICNQTDLDSCEPVSACATTDINSIKCSLEPRLGCFKVYLWHVASWNRGLFYKQGSVPYAFCRNASSVTSVVAATGGSAAWGWAAAGVGAALLLAVGAVRVLRQGFFNTNKQKEVLRRWLMHRNEVGGADAVASPLKAPWRHVLLLYAREGAVGGRALTALRDAIQPLIHGQVLDIFSPEVMSQCAAGPAQWVRSTLLGADVAVLLLQSPALACLHAARAQRTDTGLQLLSPLLPGRVVPRTPAFGDALLQYALRLLAEDVGTRSDYNKYYVATIEELPTEVVPDVVPYRRYVLPGSAGLLLRDLAAPGREPAPDALDRFTTALREFLDHARDNPDYLMDELMLVDS